MFEEVLFLVLNLPPLVYVVVALVSVLYVMNRVPANLPPIPVRGYPLVGHLPMLGKDTLEIFKEWQRKSGDLFTIYMGQTPTIIANSFELVKEAFVHNPESFSDRPHRFINTDKRFGGGIIDSAGSVWKEQRNVTVAILKSLGMGKNWYGEKIGNEVEVHLDTLSKLNGQPTDVMYIIYASVSNVICNILIGNRFKLDDPTFQKLLHHQAEQDHLLRSTSILTCFPWLKYFPGDFFNAKEILDNEQAFLDLFSAKYVKKIKAEGITEPGHSLIADYMLEERKRKESGKSTTLSDYNLIRILTNLFQGGTETVSNLINWALLYSIHHPDMQDKIYEEILDVVGTDRPPSIDDKPNMNYTNAYIYEIMRITSIVPLSLPHMCFKTTTLAGYTIPAGSTFLPNMTAVLNDLKTWGDPEVFRPERFLDKDNNLVTPEQFIPFGIGRRLCFGESLGKAELFLFLAGIFQRFKVNPEDPDKLPPVEAVFGLTSPSAKFKVKFIERQH